MKRDVSRIVFFLTDDILSCNVTALNPCPRPNQVCIEKTAKCVCKPGYIQYDDECQSPDSKSAASHGTTAAVVSIFTIALIICGLVLVIRKYNLVQYARQKINMRRNNDVMCEDVMIGDDDPPISP